MTTNMLILGGAGFLGSNLVRRCLREPSNRVTVVDSLEPRLRTNIAHLNPVQSQIHFVQGDMRDQKLMNEVVQGQDIIFNCAAQSSHPLSLQEPLFDAEINCLGNLTLLEAIRTHNKEAVVIYTSSSTVVGKGEGKVIDEDHKERPLDIYSANKSAAEKYYRVYHVAYDIKAIILRFANLYGPYGKGYPEFGFVNYFIHLAHQDKMVTVYGDGGQKRNVLFAEDAADILYLSASNPALIGHMYFATHQDQFLSVLEIAENIVSVFGRGHVSNVAWPEVRRRIEIKDALISSARLQALTGWQAKYAFQEGLAATKQIMDAEGYGQ